jgi:hypothetical protein
MNTTDISKLFSEFVKQYNPEEKDKIWASHSERFRRFWYDRVLGGPPGDLPENEIDDIVRILDRSAKGNTRESEAVARAMIAQGAWRRMFNELHSDKQLSGIITRIFEENDEEGKAQYINQLYEMNQGRKNNLTGPSANAINAFLAAYDPVNNGCIISLGDRQKLIERFGFPHDFDFGTSSIGEKVVKSNRAILAGLRSLGIDGTARTITRFCYFPEMKALWKMEHTVKREDRDVAVTVPIDTEAEEPEINQQDEIRESLHIQALLADIGSRMGMKIWIPKADRSSVLKLWKGSEDQLLDRLPLNYDTTTLKTIEQIDVLWLNKRSIVRAFEIEHTTSVYSGILRMADLLALQPNMKIKLHIVAPAAKRDKVFQEIKRPVFSLLESGPLAESCSYISYDSLRDLAKEKYLEHLSDSVLDDFAEWVESD